MRRHFFNQRVIVPWNEMPQTMVNSPSVYSFNPFNPRIPRTSADIPRPSSQIRGNPRHFPDLSALFREKSMHFQNSPRFFHDRPRADVFGSSRKLNGRERPRLSAGCPRLSASSPRLSASSPRLSATSFLLSTFLY